MISIDKETTYTWGNLTFISYHNISDAEKMLLLEWRNHDAIRKQMYSTYKIPLENHLAFINSLRYWDDRYYWAVFKGEEMIGSMNLTDVNRDQGSAEIGFYLRPNCIGSGNGYRFLKSLVDFSTKALGLTSLYAATHLQNARAAHLFKKLGFATTGQKVLTIEGKETIFVEQQLTA